MNRDQMDAELREAIDRRMAERTEHARARRERRAAYLAAKDRRRRVGLRQRHARKTERTEKP